MTLNLNPTGIVIRTNRDSRPVDPAQVELCRRFLERCERTRTGRIDSYVLKHIVERSLGWPAVYVSNGACIQAALDLGILVAPISQSLNAMIGVSRRSVRAVALELRVLEAAE